MECGQEGLITTPVEQNTLMQASLPETFKVSDIL